MRVLLDVLWTFEAEAVWSFKVCASRAVESLGASPPRGLTDCGQGMSNKWRSGSVRWLLCSLLGCRLTVVPRWFGLLVTLRMFECGFRGACTPWTRGYVVCVGTTGSCKARWSVLRACRLFNPKAAAGEAVVLAFRVWSVRGKLSK